MELGDYLLIAEAILEIPAETLARLPRLDLAESALNAPSAGFGEVEAYPEFKVKVAVLGWHLVKNHPLPDGNKRTAFLAMVDFAARNGRAWVRSSRDPEETDEVIRGVAAGLTDENEFRAWVDRRIQ